MENNYNKKLKELFQNDNKSSSKNNTYNKDLNNKELNIKDNNVLIDEKNVDASLDIEKRTEVIEKPKAKNDLESILLGDTNEIRGSIGKDLFECQEAIIISEQLLQSNFKTDSESIELTQSFADLKNDLADQIKKFTKETYEIAVVGMEKAGKSTLLNAWMKYDLLPSENKRCTYTTTEIRSCKEGEQKFRIEYISNDEFLEKFKSTQNELNKHQTGKTNRDRELLEQELEEIEKYKDEISKYLGNQSIEESFTNFETVKERLKQAISNPGEARAVKKVCIWTTLLSSSSEFNTGHSEIVLYDVPGYNSPITLHKELTKAKIASADAILFAKEFRKPDLVDSEIEILKISDATNPYIKAKDKVIVALTSCDNVNSTREFNTLIAQNQYAWKLCGINPSRVVPVCSAAELNLDSQETLNIKDRLDKFNDGKTGFNELKNAVNSCVEDSLNKVARDRCGELKNKIKDSSSRLNQLIKTDFNVDYRSEVKEKLDDAEMEKIYHEWWAKKWKYLLEEFQTYFQDTIRPKPTPDAPAYLSTDAEKFKESYQSVIDKTFKSIPSTKRERQRAIYISCMGDDGILNPIQGNTKIRNELAREAINSIDKITHELTVYLWNNIGKIIAWISNKLYNIPEIRAEMIGKDEGNEESLMRKAFDALIQRLGRPATDIFLSYPRSKQIRSIVLKEYLMELMTLDTYVDNGKMKRRGIIEFIANGNIAKNPENFNFTGYISERIIKEKPQIKKNNYNENYDDDENNYDDIKQFDDEHLNENNNKYQELKLNSLNDLVFSPDASNLDQIYVELEQDINEFIACMKNSVFYGSGIQRFYNQELDKFRRRFIELEEEKHIWFHLIMQYIKKKDTKVVIPAPNMIDEVKNRTRIIMGLKKLNETINKF